MKKKFYRAKESAGYLGIGLSTFFRKVAEGKIAEGYKLSPRATVWDQKDLDEYVKNSPRSIHK